MATIGDLLSATEDTAGLDATVIEAFTEPWLAAYRRSEGVAAGTGMGVLERGWLGLFCMATPPDFRRQGGAKAILRSLANWARRRHGQHAYPQVDAGNRPTIALYESLGFDLAYEYHYRWKESLKQVEARLVPAS